MRLLPWWTAVVFNRSNLRLWVAVLEREGRERSLWAKGRLMAGILWQGLKISAGRGVTRAQWERRMAVCPTCPIFDASLHRCRPFDGYKGGCGCFVKFIGLVRVPYRGAAGAGCWGKAFLSGAGIGWE